MSTAIHHRRCVFPGCSAPFDPPPEPLAHEGHLFCGQHRLGGQAFLQRGWSLELLVHWPSCRWCGVLLPQKRYEHYIDQGFEPGQYVYCEAHAIIEGRDPELVARRGLDDAEALADIDERRLVRFPQRWLHRLAGPLVPGRVTYVGGFSGGGKTVAVTNWIWHWVQEDKLKVHYLPTEGSVAEVMTRFACFKANADPDEALSFRYRDAEAAGNEVARVKREEIKLAMEFLRRDTHFLRHLRIDPTEELTPRSFDAAVEATRTMGSDLLVVDHCDHTEADANDFHPDIVISNQVQMRALRAAKRLGIPVLLMTQLNSRYAGASQDPTVKLRPPSADWLYNKGKKEMVGAQIIGLHRVMDPQATRDQVRRAKDRDIELWRVAMPNVMGASAMKFRFGIGTARSTVLLDYTHGRLSDMQQDALDQPPPPRTMASRDPRGDTDWMQN